MRTTMSYYSHNSSIIRGCYHDVYVTQSTPEVRHVAHVAVGHVT